MCGNNLILKFRNDLKVIFEKWCLLGVIMFKLFWFRGDFLKLYCI